MTADCLENGIKGCNTGADPASQSGDIDFDAFARIGLTLPVQWLVEQEFGSQDHGKQAWPGAAARDRMRRRWRLSDAFAIPARELFTHVLDNFPAPGLAFERFGHSLAELAQVGAAAFAASARRWIDDALAWQIVRQRPARGLNPGPFTLFSLLPGRRDFSLGLFLGLGLLEIDDGKLELFDELLAALRRLPKLFLPHLGEHEFQPLDLKRPDFCFTARLRQHLALREDHRMGSGKVCWERIRRRRHGPS